MAQDLTGGYCPKCDGYHNATFPDCTNPLKIVGTKDSLFPNATISANQLAEDSSLCRMIWNEAIEAAAILLRDTNRNGTDDVALVRKLKK